MAWILARWDAGSQARFVARMNATARALGMTATRHTDPSGRSVRGSPGVFASALATIKIRSWNWVTRSVVQPMPDCSTARSVASFMPK
jgi:D-alanyl-D-alanine carboxypeptidase